MVREKKYYFSFKIVFPKLKESWGENGKRETDNDKNLEWTTGEDAHKYTHW